MKFLFPLLIAIALSPKLYSQANFSVPDTVCVNQPVAITNLSPASSSYYWNFCLANTNMPPEGVNMGNIGGIFDGAVYMDYVEVSGNFYGFVTDNHAAKLYRLNFGNSLLNIPTVTDLGNVGGIIPLHTEGIQVVQNEGKWYAIIVGGDPAAGTTSKIVKIEFGVNIANNTPVGTNWGNLGNLSYPHDLYLFKEGANWYGVTVNYNNNSITRFDFTSTFSNTPTGTNLGNVGNLSGPTGVCAIKENGAWFVFITNAVSSTLSRLNFGASLLSSPTAVNLGNIGGTFHTAWDIDIIRYCGNYVGFVINADQSYGDLIKLDFNNNLTNAPTAISFGNLANLKFPHCLSRIFRWESDLYTFIPNVDNQTLARLKFPGCNSTSIPNSNQQNPLPIIYNAPGTYNINLTIDDGLPTQSSFCRSVVVMPELQHSPTQNLSFCTGGSVLLKSNFATRNTWSTGSKASSITISSAGVYWVETTNGACTNRDSFIVTVNSAPFQVDLGNDTTVCKSDVLVLNAKNAGASYLWNTGATTQTIDVASAGKYYVTVTANSCSSSDTVIVTHLESDFQFSVDACTPNTVRFSALGYQTNNTTWDFGDATSVSGIVAPIHSFATSGNFVVSYTVSGTTCSNYISKTVAVGALTDNIIVTQDTTICLGATKQLKAIPSLSFCWSPTLYLDNPNSPNPTTSTKQNITYYLTAEIEGKNLVVNGDFGGGNTGFVSKYNFAAVNLKEAEYFVGNNPRDWNPLLSPCNDHTGGNGNMMLVNGSPQPDVEIWMQTISISPNTNYAFSTWIQTVFPDNPAQLQFSINGNDIGQGIVSSGSTCSWKQFYATWNSGTNTSAVISIKNKNTLVWGNDFALDDISFAPVFIKRDSVKIAVEAPIVKTSSDTSFCEGSLVQLNSSGAVTYTWTPSSGLNNAGVANPLANPVISTQYIVTGTTQNGCTAKDTVNVNVLSKPTIVLSKDTTICQNEAIQLSASGGLSYSWSPSLTLSNSSIPNPLASPTSNTTYVLTAVGANTCTSKDSVTISIWNAPDFKINSSDTICINDSVQLHVSGGYKYLWQTTGPLSNAHISNPTVAPRTTTTYTVLASDHCGNSENLSTTITVLSLPIVQITKSNDIDCITPQAQLTASGGVRFDWAPSTDISRTDIFNPVVYPKTDTWYKVAVTGLNGCTAKDSVFITTSFANGSGNFYIPNAFTPNNDGKNDCFSLKHWGQVDEFEIFIFNRWGEIVFKSTNSTNCWDGVFRGQLQPSGTYIYQVRVKSVCTNGMLYKTGHITLIR